MNSNELKFRNARVSDVPEIIQMLDNDALGRLREEYSISLPKEYYDAFRKINKDPNQFLAIAELQGTIVGIFQLTTLQYLTYKGGKRILVEAVRVKDEYRGQGIGKAIFEHIIELAKNQGVHMVQLTTNKERKRAISFYESLGFKSSHEGMKLHL